jgi:hypothetical protein
VRVSNPWWPFVDMASGAESAAASKEPTMSTVTVSPETTVTHVFSPLTRTLPRATASVGVLAAVVTTAGAAVLRAAGVPLAAHGEIQLAAFAQTDPIRYTGRPKPIVRRPHKELPQCR